MGNGAPLVGSSRWQLVHAALVEGGTNASLDAPLGPRTTYRVGGNGAVVVEVKSFDDLIHVSRVVGNYEINDVLIVGNGSNMLVSDDGFDGLAIVLDSVGPDDIRIDDDGAVVVSGHVSLPQLARQSVAAQRCGLEWAVGVPGTVGGAVRMNAGGHGSDMAASVIDVVIVDIVAGRHAQVAVGDLGLRFRASALGRHHVVASVRCATRNSGADEGRSAHDRRSCSEEIAAIVRWRREHQPGGQNAGSVFVNPGVGSQSAGALIDATGLRGRRHGSAVVTDKHANFIQADPNGRAVDVVSLMCDVQDAVHAQHGVLMRSEITLVGFEPSIASRFADHTHHDPDVARAEAKLDAIVAHGNQLS